MSLPVRDKPQTGQLAHWKNSPRLTVNHSDHDTEDTLIKKSNKRIFSQVNPVKRREKHAQNSVLKRKKLKNLE